MDTKRIHRLNHIVRTAFLVAAVSFIPACATTTESGVPTPVAAWDNQKLEYQAAQQIKASDAGFDSAHLVIVTRDGVLLIAGQVETEALKVKAGEVASSMEGVRSVHNELEVGEPTSLATRSNDSWLTTKVKTKLIAHGAIDSDRISVMTEDSVVYLIGSVSRDQARYAVEVTQTVSGVSKIVKVFQYTD
jgi:osmotically-inducible protein OsmY